MITEIASLEFKLNNKMSLVDCIFQLVIDNN